MESHYSAYHRAVEKEIWQRNKSSQSCPPVELLCCVNSVELLYCVNSKWHYYQDDRQHRGLRQDEGLRELVTHHQPKSKQAVGAESLELRRVKLAI